MSEVRTGDSWGTPDWLLDRVRSVGPIFLDPASWPTNPTDAYYLRTAECDPCGLATDWAALLERCPLPGNGLVFVNPPYSRGSMGPWAEKIRMEARKGVEIIALTRGDTSTKWAQQLLTSADKVCFPKRIKFKGAKGSPNFANLIFYWGPNTGHFWLEFIDLGPIL